MKRLLILLTNDDGIYSEGLQVLRIEMEKLENSRICLVAPDRERSGSGHAITVHRPLHVEAISLKNSRSEAWAVTGTPADCTKIAIEAILGQNPDLVISGINRGPNLGTDIFYSGTVSAAIEGAILGVPSIAVSLGAFQDLDFSFAAAFTRMLVEEVTAKGLPSGTLLNVNVPPLEPSQIAGVRITRLGVRRYKNVFDKRVDPRGKVYYWLAGEVVDLDQEPDTDVGSFNNNEISVTPIRLDLTDYSIIEAIKGWSLRLPRE